MLIEKFFVPENEASELGLKAINMSRLGRYVALAGKNGAGKSRILRKLENYVQDREDNINFGQDRIIPSIPNAPFKAVRFVPKQLVLTDPRNSGTNSLGQAYSSAKVPGFNNYEVNCLRYVQKIQIRWWNTQHQHFSGPPEEIDGALAEYDSLQKLTSQLLGTKFDINSDGDVTIFGRPVATAGLSDGQIVILQLCIALHAQRSQLGSTVLLLDEPENHLHPSATIDLLKSLSELADRVQIWISTHSIPLLAYISSIEPMSIWYVEAGTVRNSGRYPEIVLKSLLGDEERLSQLHAFTGLPAQLAAINYATQSLLPPTVIASGKADPQITQIQNIITKLRNGSPLRVLDFGAGKGRMLEGISAELAGTEQRLPDLLDYFAFDEINHDQGLCEQVIAAHFSDTKGRYFTSRDAFFNHKDNGSIDVVVMCNVFHEIIPNEWLDLFASHSLIQRSLQEDGYLLLVEDQRIPVGEKAHEYGFIVLDTSHLRTLFAVKEEDVEKGYFHSYDQNSDGRLKAHLIAKPLLSRISSETRKNAIEQLKETAKGAIKRLRSESPTYTNGQLHSFWIHQLANASLFLSEC